MKMHSDLTEIEAQLAACRVIPVIAIESAEQAVPLADALIAGGLPVAEITFRTAMAAEAMQRIARERPELLLGAGTVTSAEQVRIAKDCGAKFAVAPGFNSQVVAAAQEAGLPFAPGVMTPSDVENALTTGAKLLKFFPAEAAGGIGMLKSLAGPYAHLGVKFIPTGGIGLQNFEHYLELSTVLAVGGSWVATRGDISAGNWEEISRRARQCVS